MFIIAFLLVGTFIINTIVNAPKEEGASKDLDTLKANFDKINLGLDPSVGLEGQRKITDSKTAIWPYLLLLLLL